MKLTASVYGIKYFKDFVGYGILSTVLYFLLVILSYTYAPQLLDYFTSGYEGFIQIMTIAILSALTYFYIKLFNNYKITYKVFNICIVFFLIFNITALLSSPYSSVDFLTYIHQARIFSKFGYSPYLYKYSMFFYDNLFTSLKTGFITQTTVYGPLFTLIAGLVGLISKDSLFLNVFFFKLLVIGFNLLCGYLVFKITRSRKAFFLYSWNPLIIYEIALNNHNEIFSVLFLLLCTLFLVRYKKFTYSLFAWCFFILSIFIKYYPVILTPFVFSYLYVKAKSKFNKLLFIMFSTSFLIFVFIGFQMIFPGGIFNELRNVIGISYVRSNILTQLSANLLNYLGIKNFLRGARIFSNVIFVIFYFVVIIYWFIKRNFKEKNLIKYIWISLLLFYSTFVNIFWPWYLISLVVFLILFYGFNRKESVSIAVFCVTVYGIFQYFM